MKDGDSIDLDLIKDIVLYEINHQSLNGDVFDVVIKWADVRDGDKLKQQYEFVDTKPYIIVHFDRILVSAGYEGATLLSEHDREDDNTKIEMCDYISLLRQKKLKDIGV